MAVPGACALKALRPTFPSPAPLPSYELEIGMRVGGKHENALQIVKSLLLDSINKDFFLECEAGTCLCA